MGQTSTSRAGWYHPPTIPTLLILRHAKAENAEGVHDRERPLTPRGRRAAARVGELLSDRLPDRILSSSALRTRETVAEFKQAASYFGPIEWLDSLYLAEPSACIAALAEHAGDAERVLIVGHNPGLEGLVAALTGEHVALPTAALVECALALAAWSELTLGTRGELLGLSYPRED